MAAHSIEMQQIVQLVGKTDVVLLVSNSEEGKLGELHISKGGVDWWPRNSKKYFHRVSWERLRNFLETEAQRMA
jgi:hypothetical protein